MKVGGSLLTLEAVNLRTTDMTLSNPGYDIRSSPDRNIERLLISKLGANISPAVENLMLRNFRTGIMRATKKYRRYPREGFNLRIKN